MKKVDAEQGGKLKKTTIQRPFRLRTDVSDDCITDYLFLFEGFHSVSEKLSIFVLLLGKTGVERSKHHSSTEGCK
jgi:hypothetical protein